MEKSIFLYLFVSGEHNSINLPLKFFSRFSQNFIDIREKERKRGTRGLVSVPQKYPKIDEKLLDATINETDATRNNNENENENPNKFKPEDLLELQEKITKEILSTKLQEKDMHELQVCSLIFFN